MSAPQADSLGPPTQPPAEDDGHLLPQEDWDRVVADAPKFASWTPPDQVDWREPEDLDGDGVPDGPVTS